MRFVNIQKKVPNKNDAINQSYVKTIAKLEADRALSQQQSAALIAKLEKIKEETEKLDGTVKTMKKTLIGKTVLNNLINAGVLDSICPNGDPKYRPMLHATYHYLSDVVS